MKILLISPGSPASMEYQPPLGLAYIHSFLKRNGFNKVYLFDHYITSEKALKKAFKTIQPDVIGISCNTPTRHRSLRISKLAKNLLPNTLIVFGGIHATFLSRQLLEFYPQIDYVIRGEGEQTLVDLLKCLQEGKEPIGVEGISYRRGGEIFETPNRIKWEDLDLLPFPTYIEHYSPIEGNGAKAGAMITSRGCGAGCNYCSVPKFWGRPRFRSPSNVVNEMEVLVRENGVGYIRIMDDTFSVNMERAVM